MFFCSATHGNLLVPQTSSWSCVSRLVSWKSLHPSLPNTSILHGQFCHQLKYFCSIKPTCHNCFGCKMCVLEIVELNCTRPCFRVMKRGATCLMHAKCVVQRLQCWHLVSRRMWMSKPYRHRGDRTGTAMTMPKLWNGLTASWARRQLTVKTALKSTNDLHFCCEVDTRTIHFVCIRQLIYSLAKVKSKDTSSTTSCIL